MAAFLPETVGSIADNTFQDIEIMIIDDGSTDNTGEVVAGFSDQYSFPIYYHKVSKRGKAACLNEVFSRVDLQGDYVVFMDADDLLPPDSLQLRHDAITSSNADLVIGEFDIMTQKGQVLDHRKLKPNSSAGALINRFWY